MKWNEIVNKFVDILKFFYVKGIKMLVWLYFQFMCIDLASFHGEIYSGNEKIIKKKQKLNKKKE